MKYIRKYESLKSINSIKTSLLKQEIENLNSLFYPLGITFKYKFIFEDLKVKHRCVVNFDLNKIHFIKQIIECVFNTKSIDIGLDGIGDSMKKIEVICDNEHRNMEHIINIFIDYFMKLSKYIIIKFKDTGHTNNIDGQYLKNIVKGYAEHIIQNKNSSQFENKEFLANLIINTITHHSNAFNIFNKIKNGCNLNSLYKTLSQFSNIDTAGDLNYFSD